VERVGILAVNKFSGKLQPSRFASISRCLLFPLPD
jgi:hypothetical protein